MTLYYGDGSGQYVMPVHLAAQASTIIDIGMLIAMGQPDANGDLIPNYIQEGSAVFSNPKGRAKPRTVWYGAEWMTLAVCGGRGRGHSTPTAVAVGHIMSPAMAG